jgi:P22 coat protein - gene protein 5.
MASGFTVATNEHFIRGNVYSKQITSLLLDDLFAMKWIHMLTDFPDGDTFIMPSLGEAETADFAEGAAIKYNRLDTGNFPFTIDQYKYSANSVSAQFKQDSMWASQIEAAFVPRQHRALMEGIEARIFDRMNAGQTASGLNLINTAAHRWVGSGTNETIAHKDFFKARFALTKAQVPKNNLVAVVDPSVTYALENQTNAVNLLSPMRKYEDINTNGLTTGFMFRYNFAGFDVYESNYLPKNIAETIDGKSVTVGVANFFFSATPGDTLPVVGAFRQMPTVYSKFNPDLQQDELFTICRYGFKARRLENIITVLTDTDQVT